MRAAAIVLVAGCWSTTTVAPAPPAISGASTARVESSGSYQSPAASSRSSRRREPFPLHSVWEGTYICNQGLSAVTLTIDSTHTGVATARYDFGPVPSNPTVPVGAYTLTGELHAQDGGGFAGELEATEWITRPPNYFMVPLSIESADGKTMTGTIRHPSCTDFKTTRIE